MDRVKIAKMSTPHPDWRATRTVHLAGGCRAYNRFDPSVTFAPPVTAEKQLGFKIPQYHALFPALVGVGIEPIGCDFITNSLEAKALVPTNWRPYYASSSTTWPCNDEVDNWAHIGHAGWAKRNLALWDLSRRVSHQLRVCAWRLREVSQSYRDQLHAQTAQAGFKAGVRFADGFTWHGYLSIQAFFVDCCVLRDYLAEFYSTYACPEPDLIGGKQITSMGGLCKSNVLEKIRNPNGVTQDLKIAVAEGGWLNLLGKYRDLVVHCVPLARADQSLMALTTELKVDTAHSLPAVSLPLPDDPGAISKSRAAGGHLRALEEELSLLVDASRAGIPSTDGLMYAYSSLGRLTTLVQTLRGSSPLPPEVPHLTQADIIGDITVNKV